VNIDLVVHPFRTEAADIASQLASAAVERGFTVTAAAEDAARVPGTIARPGSEPTGVDVIVAVGGDGTMLEAVRRAESLDAPILGVNAGQVGFLAEVEPARIHDALDALAAGRYEESRRMTLAALMPGRPPVMGVNDAVIEKEVTQHVIRLAVFVGSERLIRYRADAVVVATPTGSTAYTFSAGGPLVDPELEALVVTPVAPHTLFGRPIVFRPGARLRFVVEADRPARVNVDGRSLGELAPGEEVEIVRGEHVARFIRLVPRNFATSVREKFHLHDA
jgi:NAD+ kinase